MWGGPHMHPTSTDHCWLNSTRMGMNLGATGLGESQLSFALLFMSIRALSDKKNYLKFSLHVGGAGHPTNFNWSPRAQFCTDRHETWCNSLGWVSVFICTNFHVNPSIFWQKELFCHFWETSAYPKFKWAYLGQFWSDLAETWMIGKCVECG